MGLFSDALEYELDKPIQFELMKKMKESMGSMDELLYSLLDISRLDAGVIETNVEPVLTKHLLDKLMVTFLPQATLKNIDLQLECASCAVKSDVMLLENVLRNLLSNALKYTEQGTVLIRCKQALGSVSISIQDTGIGISKEHQTKIFDEFYQAHNPERDRTKGLGLGLSIAERTCDLLGHKLSFHSEQGKGSTFTLEIESADINDIEQSSETILSLPKTLNASVLVVDDERAILEGMEKMLQRWGCDVLLAESENDALIQLQRNGGNVDIIIVDYRLRDEKLGTDAAAAIRQAVSDQHLPVIVISGDTGPDQLIKVQQEGYHILHKPVAPVRIRTLMQNLLRLSGKEL
jgi:CheY-like chemotaxis protein/anti-sigma regulatory factor (Ser/Thr protein kinase)